MLQQIVLLLIIALSACQRPQKQNDELKESMVSSIAFFDKAYSVDSACYYSDVDYRGNVTSPYIHTVALSRMIYGLAYSSSTIAENKERAQLAANFQLKHMVGADATGPYYIPNVGPESQTSVTNFDIWQQAYGACGLSELYRQSKDPKLLEQIHKMNAAFIHRFQDKANGGFFGEYDAETGQVSDSKTIQSLMYPITALFGNLWLADKEHRPLYEAIIKEHLTIAYKCVWNDSLEWVNIRFDDQWIPVYQSDDMVSPGHNFQFAALLLRSNNWPFLNKEEQQKYMALGKHIVAVTLKKDIWDKGQVSEGFFEAINPHTNEILYHNKSWWQHCEALIALSFLQDDFKTEFDLIKTFYFNHFIDKDNGGEWAKVDEDNEPVIEPKGQLGKSVYHHIEMIRFLQEAER